MRRRPGSLVLRIGIRELRVAHNGTPRIPDQPLTPSFLPQSIHGSARRTAVTVARSRFGRVVALRSAALPRYCPQRSLPGRAYQPGAGPRPKSHSSPAVIAFDIGEGSGSLRQHEAFCWGVDLYNHGFYWEAHEAWEDLWKLCDRGTTLHVFLQGLIQCAAFCLRVSMAPHRQASPALAARALRKLHAADGHGCAAHLGIDISEFSQRFADYVHDPRTAPPALEFD
jgi:predicted metal-dependent hydrolase